MHIYPYKFSPTWMQAVGNQITQNPRFVGFARVGMFDPNDGTIELSMLIAMLRGLRYNLSAIVPCTIMSGYQLNELGADFAGAQVSKDYYVAAVGR